MGEKFLQIHFKHFTTVAAKIENKIVKTSKNFSFYLKNPNKKTF